MLWWNPDIFKVKSNFVLTAQTEGSDAMVRNELASVGSWAEMKQSWMVADEKLGQTAIQVKTRGHVDWSGRKQGAKTIQEAKSDKYILEFLICLPFKRHKLTLEKLISILEIGPPTHWPVCIYVHTWMGTCVYMYIHDSQVLPF